MATFVKEYIRDLESCEGTGDTMEVRKIESKLRGYSAYDDPEENGTDRSSKDQKPTTKWKQNKPRDKPYDKPNPTKQTDQSKVTDVSSVADVGYSPSKGHIMRTLIRHGLPEEVLNEIPEELLLKFKPFNCQLCVLVFPNSLMSSNHYNCKSHLKKMKAWLKTWSDENKIPFNEKLIKLLDVKMVKTPFNIMCELCRVQLTSQLQAKIHMAGRIHQNIAQGRVPPKGSNVNVKEAEENLLRQLKEIDEQIVEKQTISLVKEFSVPELFTTVPELPQEQTITTSENSSAVNSALTCEICNVVVNKEDQLIIHKNGKKHKSKEKAYLIKLNQSEVEEVTNDPFAQ